MKRTDRMLGILLELQSKGTRRAEDLAATFEVSKRSIYRDVDALCAAGVPVVAVPGQGYSLMEGYFLPPLSFTVDEAMMLLVGGDVVAQNFDDEYRRVARGAIDKLSAALPAHVRSDVKELLRSIRFIRTDATNDSTGLRRLQLIRQAIIEHRTIRFHYSARGEGAGEPRRSHREADPLALAHVDNAWYLSARCHLRGAIRNFRLSRIAELEITERTFARPEKLFERHCETAENTEEARVLFAAEATQWVRESGYYNKVAEEVRPDGLLVTLRARSLTDLVPWIMSWGHRARVLEPDTLAALVRSEAKKIIAAYEHSEATDTQVATAVW